MHGHYFILELVLKDVPYRTGVWRVGCASTETQTSDHVAALPTAKAVKPYAPLTTLSASVPDPSISHFS